MSVEPATWAIYLTQVLGFPAAVMGAAIA